jgi:hypothetical protein
VVGSPTLKGEPLNGINTLGEQKMTLKGQIQANHIPINKYSLSVATLPALIFTTVSGIEQETAGTILPDNTKASGGEQQPFELTCEIPLHHAAEVAAIEAWYKEGKDPVTATYKKTGTMIYSTIGGTVGKTLTVSGMWVSKVKYPDTDMGNEEGELALLEVTFSCDDYTIS